MLTSLKNTKLRPLSFAYLMSKIGDFSYEVVLALIALEITDGNLFLVGLVYFFKYIPYIFLAPLGGWLADNYSLKKNMICSELLKCIAAIILIILFYSDTLSLSYLVLLSILMTVGSCLYDPNFRAFLPKNLEKSELLPANSLFQVIEDSASILGPLLCALIISFSDKGYVFLFNLFTFFIASLILFFLYEQPPIRSKESIDQNVISFRQIFSDVVKHFFEIKNYKKELFIVIIGTSFAATFASAIIKFILPAAVIEISGREDLVGYIISCMSFGTVIGGILYTKVVRKTNSLQLMKAWSIYGLLCLLVSISIIIDIRLTFIFVLLMGFSGAIVDISIITNIQNQSNQNDMGRNYGLYAGLANTGDAVSGLIGGFFFFAHILVPFIVMSCMITFISTLSSKKIKGS